MKNLRDILHSGGYVIGSWINTCSPIVAELMAASGFDFLTVDAEHSAVDETQAQSLFLAIRAGNPDCTPLIRLPGHNYAFAKRFMDVGARGVIAPLINSPEQAQEIVHAVKYPPEGMRGVGFCQANMYGMNLLDELASANDQSLVCVQIEHVEGVRQIDKILDVPGVDAAFIGPYDLSSSMGITGQFDHPDMITAKQFILDACQAHGVAPGIHVVQPDADEVVRSIDKGYRLIAYSLDITMLLKACQDGLTNIHGAIKERKDYDL